MPLTLAERQQLLGDLQRVERGAFAQIVARHEQRQPVWHGRIAPRFADVLAAPDYAALRLASISLRLIRHSAICTALSAAPLRRLSDTHHSTRPFSTVASSRMRLT